MTKDRRSLILNLAPILLLGLVAGIVFFNGLGAARLWDRDEPRNASCAAEMLARGDWVVPIFNDQLRHQKPVLVYWLILSAYSIFGVTEFAARFWSAALGVGTVLMTYQIGSVLFNRTVGLLSGFVLTSSLMFCVASRAATPDASLIFCSTAALTFFVTVSRPQFHIDETSNSRFGFLAKAWQIVCFYGALGLAVLAKGPVGFILPMGIVGLFLLIVNCDPRSETERRTGLVERAVFRIAAIFAPRHFWHTLLQMRWLCGLLIVVVVASPWYILVGWRTNGEFVQRFFLEEHFSRATTSFENHSGGWWYYPVTILLGVFPWSIFAFPVFLDSDRRLATEKSRAMVFLLSWLGVQVGLFTLVQTKLPSYVTPCFPAIAILVGVYLQRFLCNETKVLDRFYCWSMWSLTIVALAVAAGLIIVANKYLDGRWELALVTLPLIFGAGWGLVWLPRNRAASVWGVAASHLAFCAVFFGWGAQVVDSTRQTHLVLDRIRAASPEVGIASYKCLESSWIFYGGRAIIELDPKAMSPVQTLDRPASWSPLPRLGPENFCRIFEDGLIITTDEFADELQLRLPRDYEVIVECENFLNEGNLVLLGRNRGITTASADGTRRTR